MTTDDRKRTETVDALMHVKNTLAEIERLDSFADEPRSGIDYLFRGQLAFKRLHPDAVTPRRAHATDAGLDLAPLPQMVLVESAIPTPRVIQLSPGATAKLKTGLAFQIPDGYVGLLVSRSSTKIRGLDIHCVIDSGYRGDVTIGVTNTSGTDQYITTGEYLAQLLIVPCIAPEPLEVDELDESDRGENGFGSTGNTATP